VSTIEDNDSRIDGGHGAKGAFAHPTHSFSAIEAVLFMKAADQVRV
jgi:hypothetical protein